MGTRGRRPTPKGIKEARGTVQPCREKEVTTVVEFPLCDEVPAAPAWITFDAAFEMWEELAPTLYAQRVMTTADVHSLAHLCRLHGKIVDGYNRMNDPTAAELSQLRMYFSEFGLTPSSRTRVAASGAKKDANPFDRNGGSGKR